MSSAEAAPVPPAAGERFRAEIREQPDALRRLLEHESYAFGLLPRWTALRDSISLTVHYNIELDMAGSTAIGLSQSGQTPDVWEYLERARKRGAFTVAITNDPTSALASTAEAVLPLEAGEEQAVAATKTYLNQLAALALLAAHAAGRGAQFAEAIRSVAGQLEELIPALESRVRPWPCRSRSPAACS